MEFNEYNESVKNWTNGILDNYRKDAELTIRYCHELIDYGEKTADSVQTKEMRYAQLPRAGL